MSRPLLGCALLHLLYQGSHHDVWIGRFDRVDGLVVVKRAVDPTDAGVVRRLVAEGERATSVEHPGLLRPIAVVDDPPGIALVYPYLAGGSLRSLLDHRGALAPGEVVALFAPVAAALDAWYDRADQHGDLKPENLLLTASGRPVVADAAPDGHGTPAYLDPAVRDGAAPSPRRDVFALGVIAYEAVTGRRPHRGGPAEVVALAAASAHRRLDTWPGLDRRVAAVIEGALAPDPHHRPADPGAFVAALRAAVDPAEVTLPTPTPSEVPADRPGLVTLDLDHRPAAPSPNGRGRHGARWVAAVATVGLVAVAWFGPAEVAPSCPTPTTVPGTVRVDLDGDGCDEAASWDGRQLAGTSGADRAVRIEVGAAGHQVRFGDWDGDGATTVATYDPSTGRVRYLDRLDRPADERVEDLAPGGRAVVVGGPDGDRVEIRPVTARRDLRTGR